MTAPRGVGTSEVVEVPDEVVSAVVEADKVIPAVVVVSDVAIDEQYYRNL